MSLGDEQQETTFFSQLRWFIIAGILLKTLSMAIDQMKDQYSGPLIHITDLKLIDALYITLDLSFSV